MGITPQDDIERRALSIGTQNAANYDNPNYVPKDINNEISSSNPSTSNNTLDTNSLDPIERQALKDATLNEARKGDEGQGQGGGEDDGNDSNQPEFKGFGSGGKTSGGNSLGANVQQASDGDWLLNPLSAVQLPTYSFRLVMVSESDSVKISRGDESARKLLDKGYTIAETGATGFNIREVNIQNIVSPNKNTRNASMLKGSITIMEPYGASLLDKIITASEVMGIKNYLKSAYYLELKFRGYTLSGEFVDNIGHDLNTKRSWVYGIKFTKCDIKLTVQGAEYKMEFINFHHHGITNQISQMNQSRILAATTVKEAFGALAKEMTESDEREWGYARHKYNFKFPPIASDGDILSEFAGKSPESWKLDRKKLEEMSIRNQSLNGPKKQMIQTGMGDNVDSLIEMILSQTEEAQKIAGRNGEKGKPGSSASNTIVWRAECKLMLREQDGYDELSGDYNYDVEWFITPYVTVQGRMDPEGQTKKAEDPSHGKKEMGTYKQKKLLRKKYDYLFTGLNTEVEEFDTNFSFAWYAMLPRLFENPSNIKGKSVSEPYMRPTTLGGYAKVDGKLRELQRSREQVKQASAAKAQLGGIGGLGNVSGGLSGIAQAAAQGLKINEGLLNTFQQASQLASSVKQFADTATQVAGLRNQLRLDGLQNAGLSGASSSGYIEDLQNTVKKIAPITFVKDHTNTQVDINRDVESDSSAGRSVYGLLVNQLYSASGDYHRLKMKIKGDPYWLGHTSLEPESKPNGKFGGTEIPNWWSGDYMLAVHLKYPLGFNDDGSPKLKSSEHFSGIYTVNLVENRFSDGKFTQTLNGYRHMNITINAKDLES